MGPWLPVNHFERVSATKFIWHAVTTQAVFLICTVSANARRLHNYIVMLPVAVALCVESWRSIKVRYH